MMDCNKSKDQGSKQLRSLLHVDTTGDLPLPSVHPHPSPFDRLHSVMDSLTPLGHVANLSSLELSQICSTYHNFSDNYAFLDASATSLTNLDRPAALKALLFGFVSVSIINFCAIAGIGVMRYLTQKWYNLVITFFVGVGVGSLTGSSFYHLLPNANPILISATDELTGKPSHSYLVMAHFSLIGVYMFFLCDKLIKIVLEYKKRYGSKNSDDVSRCLVNVEQLPNFGIIRGTATLEEHNASIDQQKSKSSGAFDGKQMTEQAHGVCVHDHSVEWHVGQSSGQAIAAVAWMIIFGDGFHNLIDGISIGTAFSESIHSGISVVLAVLCEEFPHELGDVAILVASGMTLRQAFIYNLLSATTCYLGFGIGIIVGEVGPHTTKYACGLAGGMFLYIALGCMMPEMKKAMEEALDVSLPHGIKVLFLQVTGMFCGLTLMYTMARYGELIAF